jgi:hypothetical protein
MIRQLSGRLVDMDAADPKCLDFNYRFQVSDFEISYLQIRVQQPQYMHVVQLRCDKVAPESNDYYINDRYPVNANCSIVPSHLCSR